jgi:hypothetical protein
VQIPVVLYSGGFYPRGFRTLESNDTVPGTDTTAQASGNAALVSASNRVPISGGYMTGQLFAASGVVVSGTLSRNGFNVVTVGDVETVTSTMIASGTIIDADVNISGAINANKLSFLQVGASGVATTVQQKAQQIVSAFDFMSAAQIADVIGDTEAIAVHTALQAAITALSVSGRGALFLPAGTYRITSPLLVPYGVSIFGEGGTATVLSCLNCNGINFNSASYDGGAMFYRDFAICGATGSSGNWAAVESILPSGGIQGVDSRDGLYFERLRIFDFNQAFIFNALWESHVSECKIFRCNQGVSLGTYSLVIRITNNNMILEGGFASGSATKNGIEILGAVGEGIFIRGNQIYGFVTCLALSQAIYTIFDDNDCFGTTYGVHLAGAATTGMSIRNNYFEISANNAIGIYGAPQGSEISNLVEVVNNVFITGGAITGTRGIVVGDPAATYQWNWRIRDNYFTSLKTADIQVYNARNITIEGNRIDSTTPTNNIVITGGSAPYDLNYVLRNRIAVGISADAADVAAGRIIIRDNLIAGTQSFGAIWATSGQIDGNIIGSATAAAGTFTNLKATTKVFSAFDASSVNTGSSLVLDYVLPDKSLHIVTCYMETSTNVQLGPGAYLVVRQGTSTTVTTITAFTNFTVTVNGSYKLDFANNTGSNGIIYASALKTLS